MCVGAGLCNSLFLHAGSTMIQLLNPIHPTHKVGEGKGRGDGMDGKGPNRKKLVRWMDGWCNPATVNKDHRGEGEEPEMIMERIRIGIWIGSARTILVLSYLILSYLVSFVCCFVVCCGL